MPEPGLSVAELDRLLRAADPAVLLLPPRLLRRVIKHDCQLPGIGLQVPHRKTYVCGRDRLFAVVAPQELGLAGTADLPEQLLLIAGPDPDALAAGPRENALLKYWRLLFHTRIHLALELLGDKLNAGAVRQRIARLGATEFDEVRSVLRQERFLLPPEDERSVWIEFAAVYLELRHFTPVALPYIFPGIVHPAAVDALLAEDLDVPALLAATRPDGAPDPLTPAPAPAPAPEPAEPQTPDLAPRADQAAGLGNVVRAAILRSRAGDAAGAAAALDRLAQRLQAALQLHKAEAESWRQTLAALLPLATPGLWPVAARLLYDLQKVCMDHERAVYKLDLVEWALSLGRRPIKRPLPGQQEVLALKHLRTALSRLPSAGLANAERRQFAGLLQAAIHHSEARLRDRFRPVLLGALEDVGLRPANLPERVARQKLVEELLDRIAERGFINLGDLRDALSRNQLKLPDLGGPREFLHGDPLLQLDYQLAQEMEGAYKRGEVYLRWLQRFSAAAFGTHIGRFLTRYVALPFGGAFIILEGVQHLVEPIAKLITPPSPTAPPEPPDLGDLLDLPPPPTTVPEAEHAVVHMLNPWSFILLSLFLLGVLHVPAFRQLVARGLVAVWHGLHTVVVDWPAQFLSLPLLERIRKSRFVAAAWRHVLKPLLYALLESVVLLAFGLRIWFVGLVVLFAATVIMFHSPWGRNLEEMFTDQLERAWQRLFRTLVLDLFLWVTNLFKYLVESLDRLLYSVDERLRFRTGDSRLSLVLKTAFGLLWFLLIYSVHVVINLFIEPTVNPIKHFPVVTVAAKLIVPIIPMLGKGITGVLEPVLGMWLAGLSATVIIIFLPGLAGFLVWEFKENWKLYRANRAAALKPVLVGSHGETMARLLRPGFHSGTVPKLFAKLRKAARRAQRRGRWRAFRKQRDALHHVEECVHHFIERELLRLLEESKSWGGLHLYTGAVVLCTNRIRVELHCPELTPAGVWLLYTEKAGTLEVSLAGTGWLTHLSAEQRRALMIALAGLYKLSGVDQVGEEPADAARNGQISMAFAAATIPWERWVQTWEDDQAGKGLPEMFAGSAGVVAGEPAVAMVQEV